MADFTPTFTSDPPLQNVKAALEKAGGQFIGHIEINFDGGRRTIRKTVILSNLSQAEQDAGLLFYNALHSAGLAAVTGDDF